MVTRGAIVRRALVGALLLVAAALIAAGLRTPGAAPGQTPAAALGTPLWSVRRVPQTVVDAVGAQHLHAALTDRTAPYAACVLARDDTTGAEIAAVGPPDARTPASTMKLLTATAALADLGAEFRFTTRAVAARAPTGGAVDRLYLVGGGDPLLSTPERIAIDAADPDQAGLASTPLADLADGIVAAGIRSIPGGVAGVDGRYDPTRVVEAWSTPERNAIGPIGDLTVNDGYAGPAGTGAEVVDPAVNAATELARLLAARGVAVGPATRADRAPADPHEIATLASPPLPDVLTEMLSASDNLTAEMLTREMGSAAGAGTTTRGVQAIRDTLTRLGVDLDGTTLVDGSGLSHTNALTCRSLMGLLGLTSRARFAPVRDGLAIAGQRGTLATRLRGTSLAGNLEAKTGTLSGVTGLAGFVTSDRPLTFALLANGDFGESAGYALREALATEIAAYPQLADRANLVPAPGAPIPPD